MSAREDIWKGPVNMDELLKKGKQPRELVDSLFTNFMYYAKRNWKYIASASAGGEALLNGTATQVPCGGIATALKMLIEEKLHQTVQYITISGYVWTKPNFLCFDQEVKGNVFRAEAPGVYNQGCFFNEHYFIQCNGKFYDPCLNSIYNTQNEAVLKHYNVNEIISKGAVMAGNEPNTLLVFRKELKVPGWQQGAWMIVNAANLQRYVTDKYDLLYISTKLKTGKAAEAARAASKKLFTDAGRLQTWKDEHTRAGIRV
ncbi:MAG TPA: hypothetical protein VG603_16580 [Chitinophagales bacterium]|nr:hypothetical protein [Chitinophagales bacterium]